MARNTIQFQKGLSLRQFQRLYGTEAQCEAALEKTRWPDGFRCPRCGRAEHGLVCGRRLKRYQCRACSHQATLTAGTILQATKLPLPVWFLAFYLIGQALAEGLRVAVDRDLLPGAEPSSGRQLRHRLAAAQQVSAGHERA